MSPLLVSGHARVTVVSGPCAAGLVFSISRAEVSVGRKADGVTLAEDVAVSPVHCSLGYDAGALWVEDAGSHNGVYLRTDEKFEVRSGAFFRAGGQVLTVRDESLPPFVGPDGTHVDVSPISKGDFSVAQILEGGLRGLSVLAVDGVVTVGAADASLRIADDETLSATHAKVERSEPGRFVVRDLGSTNGTYQRLESRTPLRHGDVLCVGNTLLRVDIV
jgi:pSer/pThr/pTyr-binding forkhead associated (FHA) protein